MLHKYYYEYIRKFRKKMIQTLLITAIGIFSVVYLFDSVFNGLILDFITILNVPALTKTYNHIDEIFMLISLSFGCIWLYLSIRRFVNEVYQFNTVMDNAKDTKSETGNESMFDDVYELLDQNKQAYRKALAQEQESNQLKEHLITSLGSNLHLPIQKLRLYMNFIKEDIPAEMLQKYQGVALKQAIGLQVMLQETFQIANQQYFSLQSILQPTNIGRIIMQLLDDEQMMIEQQQIVIETQIDERAVVRGDREAIAYLLGQALKNVLLYTHKADRVTIKVSCGAYITADFIGYGTSLEDYELLACKQRLLQYSHDEEAHMGFVYMEQMMKCHKGVIQITSLPRSLRIEMKFPV